MLLAILGILLTVGVVWLLLYLLDKYFPTLGRMWRAAAIALIVLAFVRLIAAWLCGLLCGTP